MSFSFSALKAVLLGQEKFAICPICTQAPPADVFPTAGYRARCIHEVRRLQRLWEAAQREEKGHETGPGSRGSPFPDGAPIR